MIKVHLAVLDSPRDHHGWFRGVYSCESYEDLAKFAGFSKNTLLAVVTWNDSTAETNQLVKSVKQVLAGSNAKIVDLPTFNYIIGLVERLASELICKGDVIPWK